MKKIAILLSFLMLAASPVSYGFLDSYSDDIDNARDIAADYQEDIVKFVNNLDESDLEKIGLNADDAEAIANKTFKNYNDMWEFLQDEFGDRADEVLEKLRDDYLGQ